MNILYIHGLDSKLSADKKAILSQYGTVNSPDIDYYNNPAAIDMILKKIEGKDIDVVIGSSMGGFAAYYISTAIEKPALLFNPALQERSVEQEVPSFSIGAFSFKYFVIGAQDTVVNPGDTLRFLSLSYNNFTNFHIHLRPELDHGIPVPTFEEEVRSFFQVLQK